MLSHKYRDILIWCKERSVKLLGVINKSNYYLFNIFLKRCTKKNYEYSRFRRKPIQIKIIKSINFIWVLFDF